MRTHGLLTAILSATLAVGCTAEPDITSEPEMDEEAPDDPSSDEPAVEVPQLAPGYAFFLHTEVTTRDKMSGETDTAAIDSVSFVSVDQQGANAELSFAPCRFRSCAGS